MGIEAGTRASNVGNPGFSGSPVGYLQTVNQGLPPHPSLQRPRARLGHHLLRRLEDQARLKLPVGASGVSAAVDAEAHRRRGAARRGGKVSWGMGTGKRGMAPRIPCRGKPRRAA